MTETNTLDVHINPVHDVSHPDGALINIVTGQIAHPDVNVDDAVSIGKQAIREFGDGWVESFYAPVTVIPPTLGSRKNTVRVRNKTQRVNSLCFIQRSIKSYSISLFLMRIQSPTDTNRLSSSLSMTNKLRIPVYMCV